MGAWEAVIGLEIHAQLCTRSKIFCGCSTAYGAPPNSQTCSVCLGHPGALPVLNDGAVELALRAALALGCEVRERSRFARKHYFYPDLPKGYQISQYDEPVAEGGEIVFEHEGAERRVGVIRLHLEEDAGKLLHGGPGGTTRVDLNRAGVPLIEIVTRPEVRGPAEAYRLLERLRSLLRYTAVCDGNLEEGSLRCDANVSIRPGGSEALGTRTELKNLNSFRNVERALTHEIDRQIGILEAGGRIVQETVLWDAAGGVTRGMRGKEEAPDYRYFPDPDLPPLVIAAARVEHVRAELPELPSERKRRLAATFALAEHEAQLLTLEAPVAELFEQAARESGNARAAANFVLNDLPREQNAAGRGPADVPFAASRLTELIRLVDRGEVSVTAARQEVFPAMFATGEAPETIVRRRGLGQVSDEVTLRASVREVLAKHPDQVAAWRAGKSGLTGFFVGKVVRGSGGRANPQRVAALVAEELERSEPGS